MGAEVLRNTTFDVTVQLIDQIEGPWPATQSTVVTLTSDGGAVEGVLRLASDPAGEEPLTATVPLGASSVTFEDVLFDGLSGEAGGDVTITATVAGPSGTVTGTSDAFSVRDVTMEVTTDRTSLPANGADTARITVRLASAAGVGVEGETIRLATTLGTFVDGAAELGQSVERTTNAEGVATIDLRASRQVGTAVVTALCPGACSKTVEVAFVGANTDPLVIPGDGVAWLYPPAFDVTTTGVTYRVGTDGEPVTIDANDLRIPIRIDDLENGVAYTVEVRGETASGSLPWSEALPFTPGTVTAPLAQLRLADGISGPFEAENVGGRDRIRVPLILRNDEPEALDRAWLLFTPPDGMRVLAVEPAVGTVTQEATAWFWQGAPLAPNDVATFEVTLEIDDSSEGGAR